MSSLRMVVDWGVQQIIGDLARYEHRHKKTWREVADELEAIGEYEIAEWWANAQDDEEQGGDDEQDRRNAETDRE